MVKGSELGGIEAIQAQKGVPSPHSTSQAWQDPIKHPVGIKTPARSATVRTGSPTSASTVTSSGKNRILTFIESRKLLTETKEV